MNMRIHTSHETYRLILITLRWMGETKVLIETVHPRGLHDIQRLEQLHSDFQDARFIWETSGYKIKQSQSQD
jgi:hypothetical protein